jgi:hypothetical protein
VLRRAERLNRPLGIPLAHPQLRQPGQAVRHHLAEPQVVRDREALAQCRARLVELAQEDVAGGRRCAA